MLGCWLPPPVYCGSRWRSSNREEFPWQRTQASPLTSASQNTPWAHRGAPWLHVLPGWPSALAGQSWTPRPVGAEGARGSPAAPRPPQPCLQAAMGQCPLSPAGAGGCAALWGCAAPQGCAACACWGQPGGLCGTRGSRGCWRGRAVELLPWELPLPQPAVRNAAVPPQLSSGFPAARAGSRCLGPCSQPSPRPWPRRRNCHVRSRWCHLQ